jgi:hypothetical protein
VDGPTYVSLHPSGKLLLVANYFGGSVAVLPVLEGGRLGDLTDVKKDEGKVGPTRARKAPPGSFAISGHDRTHAHMIQADPSGQFVLHVDLGLDRIFAWKFNGKKGALTPADTPSVALPPGDGPRHFHFHPNGRWLYSIQEEGSTASGPPPTRRPSDCWRGSASRSWSGRGRIESPREAPPTRDNRTAQALGSWLPLLKTMAPRLSFFRLIEALQEKAVALALEVLGEYPALFEGYWLAGMRKKLGLQTGEATDLELIRSLLDWMQASRADFTNTFRGLS